MPVIPPMLLAFIKEVINRIKTKSPRFFFILQMISGSLVFAGYVPSMLQQWVGMEVAPHVISLCERIAAGAIGLWTGSLLTVDTKPVAQTKEGDILKQTNEKTMPFTFKSEAKAEAKKETELPEATIEENGTKDRD